MMVSMKRILALISGRGTNLQSIAQACERERWAARLVAVVSDRVEAPGCALARGMGLPVHVISPADFPDRAQFQLALGERITRLDPDVVVLAGFMRILDPVIVERHAGRVLNIHPSLLPALPGLATHRRALEAGVRVHGATVHYVSAGVDTGPIIAQASLLVSDDDDEHSLAARVLAIEHELYPMALRWHLEGRLRLEGQRVRLDREALEELRACKT
jgi:phosphoribosylglycinamide formyltransferase-1